MSCNESWYMRVTYAGSQKTQGKTAGLGSAGREPSHGRTGLSRLSEAPSTIVAKSPGEEELAEFKSAVLAKLALAVGKDPASATDRDWFVATAYAIRDRIIHRWLAAERASNSKAASASTISRSNF